MTQFRWLYCYNQIALCDWNWLRIYLIALANLTVVKKQYPCVGCYVTCMFCIMNRFGGTLSPLHLTLTPVHDKTEVGLLVYVLTQLWGQINPSWFQSPLPFKYHNVFMWIKYFEFELGWTCECPITLVQPALCTKSWNHFGCSTLSSKSVQESYRVNQYFHNQNLHIQQKCIL